MPGAAAGMSLPNGGVLDLTIAGIHLAFRAAPGLALAAPGFEYPPFLCARSADRRIPVNVLAGPPPAIPGAARLAFDTGDGWQLFEQDERRWLRMPHRGEPAGRGAATAVWQVAWHEPLVEAQLWVAPQQVRDATVHHVIQYPMDQILVTHALLDHGALLVHAAGAATPGGGIAFIGVSGAGKSTVTRLLNGSDGFDFLSDDRVVARPCGDGYRMHGTPWAGDAGVAKPDAASLDTLCFLRQAPAPALRRLAPGEALERLLAVTTLPWFDARRIGRALETAGRLAGQVTAYELAFTPHAGDTLALLAGLRRAA